jgi:GntR family transcriptional regulator / MocR family aminotransferase
MGGRVDRAMWGRLFELSAKGSGPLQARIRQTVVTAILDGRLAPGTAVPSSRELADQLGVARNTVVLAYQHLVDDGFLVSRERSGYFVSTEVSALKANGAAAGQHQESAGPHWAKRFVVRPSAQRNIVKPQDWQSYPYPFLYGQFDPTLFPTADWRECSRRALGAVEMKGWAPDLIDGDDPLLIEQIRTRVLPRRGVWVTAPEVMVTIGAQQALFLLAELLVHHRITVGIENPGYPDARNIFSIKTPRIHAIPVDGGGAAPEGGVAGCDYVYLTPSYQCPTTATMPLNRREALLAQAAEHDFIIIEDDYETETNFSEEPTPALKSLDGCQRVIYIGSLSKILAPGLRLGYIVAPAELIREARAMRRLMLRHPPANNQRTAALFLSLGHHEALARRLAHIHRDRSLVLKRALDAHLPDFAYASGPGGSSYWVTGPDWLDARELAERAMRQGVLLEPGDVFFTAEEPPLNHLRLGFSSIAADRIEAGIAQLAAIVALMRPAGAPKAGVALAQ